MADRQEIHAIHSEDQEALLEQLGLRDSFNAGLLKCGDCERPVQKHGLGLIRMNEKGEIEVACADTACSNTNEEPRV